MDKCSLDSKLTISETIDYCMLNYAYERVNSSEVLFSNDDSYLILCRPFSVTLIIPKNCDEICKMVETNSEDAKFVEFAARCILHTSGLSYVLKRVETALSTSHERGYLQGRRSVQNEIKQILGVTYN